MMRTTKRGEAEMARQSMQTTSSLHCLLESRPTKNHAVLRRSEIDKIVREVDFGRRLTKNGSKAAYFEHVARIARELAKDTDITSKVWRIKHQEAWMQKPANLLPVEERASLHCIPDVYDYAHAPEGTLVVDFANKHVGGGCFGAGFVQEEQMVAQSTDFAVRLHKSREHLGAREAASYEGVHFDAWWPRTAAEKKEKMHLREIEERCSESLTILAVDAPVMRSYWKYDEKTMSMLATKVQLIFEVAEQLSSPCIFSGLLGGGAFRGNKPLVLLWHLLMQPSGDSRDVIFHYPVFTCELESNIPRIASMMLEELRKRGVTTLGEAFREVLSWNLPTSWYDKDLHIAPVDLGASSPKRAASSEQNHGLRPPKQVTSCRGAGSPGCVANETAVRDPAGRSYTENVAPCGREASRYSSLEKTTLQVARRLREIDTLQQRSASGEILQSNQKQKVTTRDDVKNEFRALYQSLPSESAVRGHVQDVASALALNVSDLDTCNAKKTSQTVAEPAGILAHGYPGDCHVSEPAMLGVEDAQLPWPKQRRGGKNGSRRT